MYVLQKCLVFFIISLYLQYFTFGSFSAFVPRVVSSHHLMWYIFGFDGPLFFRLWKRKMVSNFFLNGLDIVTCHRC